jgi:hypothetical protein
MESNEISQEQTGFEVICEENSRYIERNNKLLQAYLLEYLQRMENA